MSILHMFAIISDLRSYRYRNWKNCIVLPMNQSTRYFLGDYCLHVKNAKYPRSQEWSYEMIQVYTA